jgi:N-acyl-D-aspartate/D-glutamate deacylase
VLKFGTWSRFSTQCGHETADLVVFDLAAIRDKATFFEPHQHSEGIDYVFVNGAAVVDAGKLTHATPDKVLIR